MKKYIENNIGKVSYVVVVSIVSLIVVFSLWLESPDGNIISNVKKEINK